jgi:hypothetical protein
VDKKDKRGKAWWRPWDPCVMCGAHTLGLRGELKRRPRVSQVGLEVCTVVKGLVGRWYGSLPWGTKGTGLGAAATGRQCATGQPRGGPHPPARANSPRKSPSTGRVAPKIRRPWVMARACGVWPTKSARCRGTGRAGQSPATVPERTRTHGAGNGPTAKPALRATKGAHGPRGTRWAPKAAAGTGT